MDGEIQQQHNDTTSIASFEHLVDDSEDLEGSFDSYWDIIRYNA